MKYGKALEEVWQWRKTLEKKLDDMTPEMQRKYLNEKTDEACRKYGLRIKKKTVQPVHA